MSTPGSAQISPRVLSACERLENAIARLKGAVDGQGEKVNASELAVLQNQVDGLKQDNLALSEALEAYADADYDNQFEQLKEKLSSLEDENITLKETNDSLKEFNGDVSQRLEKLIGKVQLVLEEKD